MGLSSFFKKLTSSVGGLVTDIAGAAGGLIQQATPLISALAPAFAPALSTFVAGRFGAFRGAGGAGGLVQQQRGSQAVVRSQLAMGQCPVPGVVGNALRGNAVFGAATNPPNNPRTQVARPFFGQQQIFNQFVQARTPQFPQTTSFNQQAFGAPVAPSFRPFAPSFRSGQPGFSGQFQPGISRGLAPSFGFGFGGF